MNVPQLRFAAIQPKESVQTWGRATGKSTIIAWLMHMVVKTMPRAAWTITGATYQAILSRTLPSTRASLERLGYYHGVHYLIGSKPKAGFEQPYQPPFKYDNAILFRNGTLFHLVSQDKGGGSARGLNTDGAICDESLMLDKEKFDQEVSTTIRGNYQYFGKCRLHGGVHHFTSMPYGSSWLLNAGDYYERDGNDIKLTRAKLIEMQLAFIDEKDPRKRIAMWPEIDALNKRIRYYPDKNGFLYSEANVFDNLTNIKLKYLENERRKLDDYIFRVEVLNMRTDKVQGGFYANLDPAVHTYTAFDNDHLTTLAYKTNFQLSEAEADSRQDADCQSHLPLRIAVDWGAKITCLSVAQQELLQLTFLKDLYVKSPLILDDLANAFVKYYAYHLCKEVYFHYDHTGNSKQANSDLTYAEQFAKILRKAGWTVYMVSKGAAPEHKDKYLLISRLLKELDPRHPRLRFNKHNCKYLLLSMSLAPITEVNGVVKKNKNSERSSTVPAEQATHLSDTFDILVWGLYQHLLASMPTFMDNVYGK